ncbi:MAG: hypothetical protein GC192_21230 [Bacteroidetes bacterium]|nr:hypothetical protein [Bacteroidota bacterium]
MDNDFTPLDKNRHDRSLEDWLRQGSKNDGSGNQGNSLETGNDMYGKTVRQLPVYADAWFDWKFYLGSWRLKITDEQYPQDADFSQLASKSKGFIANMTMEIYGARVDRIRFWKEGNILRKGRWVAAFED